MSSCITFVDKIIIFINVCLYIEVQQDHWMLQLNVCFMLFLRTLQLEHFIYINHIFFFKIVVKLFKHVFCIIVNFAFYHTTQGVRRRLLKRGTIIDTRGSCNEIKIRSTSQICRLN